MSATFRMSVFPYTDDATKSCFSFDHTTTNYTHKIMDCRDKMHYACEYNTDNRPAFKGYDLDVVAELGNYTKYYNKGIANH